MIPTFIDKSQIPHKPGVYIYRNSDYEIIYVGKAIDLYHRVASYFNGVPDSPKTAALVANITQVETIVVESELEALILEAELIKKHLPRYNISLTDDKDYLYIKVTKEEFPKIVTARKNDLTDTLDYFGPFPSSRTVRTTLKKLRRVFPWCQTGTQTNRPCFYYHLGLCPGPCAGKIERKDYLKIISNFRKFMSGKKDEVIQNLESEMNSLAKSLEFEKAEQVKRSIDGISYLLQSNHTKNYLENPNFLENQNQLSLKKLQDDLGLNELPNRIECYDISNISGQYSTGSLVVLTGAEVDKRWYRRFKIHLDGKPNDTAMMAEMIRRRLKHQEWPTPDLIIIDGGRGQVRAAYQEIEKSGWKVSIFGLAKREEWLYTPGEEIIKLPKSSLSLRLLQKIRDEAHRFAVSYHRKLRLAHAYT